MIGVRAALAPAAVGYSDGWGLDDTLVAAVAGHAAPWSWATGGFLRGQIIYEVA